MFLTSEHKNEASGNRKKALQKCFSYNAADYKNQSSMQVTTDYYRNLMQLQKTIGNQAVLRMLDSMVPERDEKENNTGLPDNLKTRVEKISGLSMEDVNVHYNSAKPAEYNALAYTKGSDIHIAPGQEQNLPHEAWHVVQQKQGRVKPDKQMNGELLNNSNELEHEADLNGSKAEQDNM